MNPTDRLFLDQPAAALPLVHGEIRFSGPLDPGRLRLALEELDARHPMLSARVGPSGDDWLLDAGVRSDLAIGVAAGAEGLAGCRSRILGTPIDVRAGPPLTMYLIRGRDGDHLIATGHHAVMDGVGMFRILADLGHAYAGKRLPPAPDWEVARSLAVQGVHGDHPASVVRDVRQATRVAPVRPAPDVRLPEQPRVGAMVRRLGEVETANVESISSRQIRLVAAIATTIRYWNRTHGHPVDPLTFGLAVNLRPHAAWSDGVCNASLVWPVAVPAVGDRDVVDAIAKQCSEVRLGRRSRAARGVMHVLAARTSLPVWARRAMAVTTTLSTVAHLGRVIDFGPDAPAVTLSWGTPPVSRSSGISFSANLDGHDGWIAARHHGHRLSASAAEWLLDQVVHIFGVAVPSPTVEAV